MPVKILLAMGLAVTAKLRAQEEVIDPVPLPFVSYKFGVVPMHDAPIEPSWIIAGAPRARISRCSAGFDGTGGAAVWDCSAGTFRWHFVREETVVILEGEVHVTAQDGTQRLLSVGDIAFFRAGTWATWRIDTYVRKVAHTRRPLPKLISSALKLVRSLKGGAQQSL
ncbi:cupin domain-containing protein [Rhizobium sp. FY34]|uniref:cupin domain-containing protein n=1 Tax=Rhizobium sp. FY34 TaxID=2562309 RepID=UPI0010C04020|nr:cupin domain-containing protein [Rhizobium sp. FY34]